MSGHLLKQRKKRKRLEDYMVLHDQTLGLSLLAGPRDISSHSREPCIFSMYSGVIPKILLSTIFVGAWAAAFTIFSK
jgi:hypothetical protein